MRKDIAKAWDTVYGTGSKYAGEPPLPFTQRIVHELDAADLLNTKGLYVGCGNGRNFLPLLDLGLYLEGLDIAQVALDQVLEKNSKAELLHGDFLEFDPNAKYGYIIAIQVFQHGDAKQVAQYFKTAANLLYPGGMLFLRVRSVNTPIKYQHEVTEKLDDGSFSIRYKDGPKVGLLAHYFSEGELNNLSQFGFEKVGEIEEIIEDATPPHEGHKIHLEGVWRKV